MPHGITRCYLPPGRGDIPAVTPAEAGTRPRGMQGWCALLPFQRVMLSDADTRTGPAVANWTPHAAVSYLIAYE